MYAFLLLILVSLVESPTRKKSNDDATVFYNSMNSMYLRTDLFDLKCQSNLLTLITIQFNEQILVLAGRFSGGGSEWIWTFFKFQESRNVNYHPD